MHSCYISKLPFSVTGIKLEVLIFKFHQHVLRGELQPAHTAAGKTTALGIKNSNRAIKVEDQAMHGKVSTRQVPVIPKSINTSSLTNCIYLSASS